jgi:hypothetical protein
VDYLNTIDPETEAVIRKYDKSHIAPKARRFLNGSRLTIGSGSTASRTQP